MSPRKAKKRLRPPNSALLVRGGDLSFEKFQDAAGRWGAKTGGREYGLSVYTFPGMNPSQIVMKLRDQGTGRFEYGRIRVAKAGDVRKRGFTLVQSSHGHVRIAFTAEPDMGIYKELVAAFDPPRPAVLEEEL